MKNCSISSTDEVRNVSLMEGCAYSKPQLSRRVGREGMGALTHRNTDKQPVASEI